ncbi:AAA family ATPase [Salinicoccus luteus]|uniref:AAA family ATPase n=1 Tax=Salinicoccus luteus TaxID=367840 RepID=UPI0004E0E5DF|nr:SMC family ATPase [Salinicoccus luteus]
MKPIRINMQYFGPFENETIDFDRVRDSMFLIGGRTGSGKTMIFDAITYALYGTLSTSDRAEGSVRSQFATDNDISSIRLEFEIRGKRYTVERTLSYSKEGRKTPVPPKAVLYDASGEVLEGSINGVKQKVLDILQLNAEQFRQILILPQGEFKRLLTSSSEQKQEILRTLFRTERFVQFEKRLNELKKEKLSESAAVEAKIEGLFNTVSSGGLPEADALLEADYPTFTKRVAAIEEVQTLLEAEKGRMEDGLEENRKALEAGRQDLQQKRENNRRLEELEEIKSQLSALEADRSEIASLEASLEEYRAVKEMEYALKTEDQALRRKKEAEAALSELEVQSKQVAGELDEALSDHAALGEKDALYKKAERWLNSTERFMDDDEIAHLDETIGSLNKRKREISRENDALSQELASIEQTLASEAWDHRQSDQLNQEKFQIDNAISTLRQEMEEERANSRYDEEKARLTEEIEAIGRQCETIESARDEKKNSIKSRFSSADGVHIEHLVQHLEVGRPCPVCQQNVETLPVENEYLSEAEEAELKKFETDLEALLREKDSKNRRITVIEELLAGKARRDIAALEASLREKQAQRDRLSEEIEADRKKFEHKQELDQRYNKLNRTLGDNRLEENNIQHSLSRAENLASEFKTQSGYERYEDFTASFRKCRQALEDYQRRLRNNEKRQQDCREQKSRLEEKLSHQKDQLKTLNAELEETTPDIDRFTKKTGRDRAYLLSVLERTDAASMEESIKAFHSKKEVLESRRAALLETVSTRDIQDTGAVEEEIRQLEEKGESLTNERARLMANLEHNRKTSEKMEALIAQHNEELEEIHALVALVDAVSGRNEQKVSLERYVLTYYLDRILHIANVRLLEMTNHRYELRRSTSKSSRKTGLDIEVFDFYNNRPRHITSLSGGESFQAALTLALALNEALQQESGGISLDTMLIDEGFGTLDPETLDMAVNTLMELQTHGKMVGIISHVEELKERMENILEVTAVNERSTTNFK